MGFLADQVLTFWQSASLWAGLAAGAGHLWPVWLGFRSGGQAQAPLMALAVRFTPLAFVVAVAGYLLGRVAGGPRVAVAASLVGFVGCTWAGWLWDLPALVGVRLRPGGRRLVSGDGRCRRRPQPPRQRSPLIPWTRAGAGPAARRQARQPSMRIAVFGQARSAALTLALSSSGGSSIKM